jgi:hypothetical protein
MDRMPGQKRSPIVMLFLGIVAGAIGGWFAHRAIVAPRGEVDLSRAIVVPRRESLARDASPANSAPGPLVHRAKTETHAAASASEAEVPLSAKNAASRAETSAVGDASAQPSAPSSQQPMLDDLLDSVSIRCTFGQGNGGNWIRGKLTVGDAAWQGGPVDFQSIDYSAGTAQMLGNVAHSRTGQVPVNVTTTSSKVNFTGFAANGTLTVISIFAKYDAAGHHTAALSMHDGQYDMDTAQFYGVCNSALKGLNSASQ